MGTRLKSFLSKIYFKKGISISIECSLTSVVWGKVKKRFLFANNLFTVLVSTFTFPKGVSKLSKGVNPQASKYS